MEKAEFEAETRRERAAIRLQDHLYACDGPLYCVNGFYRTMRANYLLPKASVTYFVVTWDTYLRKMSWEQFKHEFIVLYYIDFYTF